MKIAMEKSVLEALSRLLEDEEISEALGNSEYALDLFDIGKPMSINLELRKDGIDALAAAELLFHEEMDGWYLGERIEDAGDILSRILEALGV